MNEYTFEKKVLERMKLEPESSWPTPKGGPTWPLENRMVLCGYRQNANINIKSKKRKIRQNEEF